MRLTKCDDGLHRHFEMLLFFYLCDKKGKVTSGQGTQYQDSFLFCKSVYSISLRALHV